VGTGPGAWVGGFGGQTVRGAACCVLPHPIRPAARRPHCDASNTQPPLPPPKPPCQTHRHRVEHAGAAPARRRRRDAVGVDRVSREPGRRGEAGEGDLRHPQLGGGLGVKRQRRREGVGADGGGAGGVEGEGRRAALVHARRAGGARERAAGDGRLPEFHGRLVGGQRLVAAAARVARRARHQDRALQRARGDARGAGYGNGKVRHTRPGGSVHERRRPHRLAGRLPRKHDRPGRVLLRRARLEQDVDARGGRAAGAGGGGEQQQQRQQERARRCGARAARGRAGARVGVGIGVGAAPATAAVRAAHLYIPGAACSAGRARGLAVAARAPRRRRAARAASGRRAAAAGAAVGAAWGAHHCACGWLGRINNALARMCARARARAGQGAARRGAHRLSNPVTRPRGRGSPCRAIPGLPLEARSVPWRCGAHHSERGSRGARSRAATPPACMREACAVPLAPKACRGQGARASGVRGSGSRTTWRENEEERFATGVRG
jgi:hypothetical protein